MIYIFGYGSLMFPAGWNSREMAHTYTWDNLTPGILQGYKRGLFAEWGVWSFYGLYPEVDSEINGILAPIFSPSDLEAFAISENLGETYQLAKIENQFEVGPVYTLVCDKGQTSKRVYPGYISYCWRGIEHWGKEFRDHFLATGGSKEDLSEDVFDI